jgi:ribosomal-protein-alanine N-acetyltransferase
VNEDIRQVGIAHADVLSVLHAGCFEKSWDGQAMVDILAMPGAFALICGPEQCPQGFILFRLAAEEAEIISIGVTLKFRKTGQAGSLLKAAIARARKEGAARMFLEVAEDNAGACALYERCGFTICGTRKGYYGHGVSKIDALVYALEIKNK